MNEKFAYVIIIILSLLCGILIGASIGAYQSLNYCLDVGFKFIKEKNISIDIDEEFLRQGIFQYKYQLGKLEKCTPILSQEE
jgi:hypothetical protein